MDVILRRRSIRKYAKADVAEQDIRLILQAAMSAPSAGNQQPWHFIVTRERKTLDAVTDVHPHSSMIKEAPLAIFVCADLNAEKHKGYWVQDCSACTQNILLAVESLGLGAVWLGVYPREDRVKGIKKLLNLPEHIMPFSVIPIGHSAEKPDNIDRFDQKRIHQNSW
ncbi:MAG: nitroreductase family protein [Candidatus Omnitrophota bacterium]|nr:nitroreductase family protein [Candidatus Omnitrophota bacterium]